MSFDPNSDSNTSSHLDYANRRASVTVQNDEKRSNEYLYQVYVSFFWLHCLVEVFILMKIFLL